MTTKKKNVVRYALKCPKCKAEFNAFKKNPFECPRCKQYPAREGLKWIHL